MIETKEHPLIRLQKIVNDFKREALSTGENKIIIDLEYDIEDMLMHINNAIKDLEQNKVRL